MFENGLLADWRFGVRTYVHTVVGFGIVYHLAFGFDIHLTCPNFCRDLKSSYFSFITHPDMSNTEENAGNNVNLTDALATEQNAAPVALDLPSLTQAIAGAIREQLTPHLQQQRDQTAHLQGLLENRNRRTEDDDDDTSFRMADARRTPAGRTDGLTDIHRFPSMGSSAGDLSSSPLATSPMSIPSHLDPAMKKPPRPYWDNEDPDKTNARWNGYRELETAVQSESTPKDKSIKV